jgi:lysophospholipid acyltransferase (LPLAT)-like uncharacterized protein
MATPQLLKRIVASPPVQWIMSAVGAAYVLLIKWTGPTDRPAPPPGGPFIVAMWHGRLALLHHLRHSQKPLIALISTHRDGQLISKCAWWFDMRTVAGSSSRGGVQAVRELMRLARAGHSLFITPDGPRGPRMQVNEGIVDIARLSGLPILPASISTSRGKFLRTWDRFLVPLPFSRTVIRWGEPIYVTRDSATAEVTARLTASLTAVQESADRAVDRTAPA